MPNSTSDSSLPGEYYCPSCDTAFGTDGECPSDGSKLIHLGVPIDPLLGRDIDGKFTIREKLGEGGMGAVYRAKQHNLGREVAIKLIHARHSSNPGMMIKRFLREAKLASRLGHPNAVSVIDFGQTRDGACYLVMELVTGRTLSEVLRSEGVFRLERLVRIAVQICDVLECAHALEIVHRDLKPSNVMLLALKDDFVKILDFGLAKSVAANDATPMTSSNVLLGTPAYLPPEAARGQPCDGRGDLYSLGVMLYLLGSGSLPFQSNSTHELITLHCFEPAPPMPGVPRALVQIVERLLRKDPAERFQTAAAVREALERALVDREAVSVEGSSARTPTNFSDSDTPTRAAGSLDTSAPQGKGARRRLALATAGSLLVAGAVTYLAGTSNSPPPATGTPQPSLVTADAGMAALPQIPDAAVPVTSIPADAAPPEPPVPPRAPPNPRKPAGSKPAHPPEPTPREPVHAPKRTGSGSEQQPPDAQGTPPMAPEQPPAGSGSEQREKLPF